MVDFLVDRFSRSVQDAFDDMGPAVAAWDTIMVPSEQGFTRNRSFDAFLRNPEPRLTRIDPARLGESNQEARERQRREAVDRVWRLLRVDRCNDDRTACHAKGAFSIYAIHGTGNPPANPIIDGDVHAIIERGLERHIESLARAHLRSSLPRDCDARSENTALRDTLAGSCTFASQAFHLFANGTEGDVSPNHDPGTRCSPEEPDKKVADGDAALVFRAGRRPRGPRTPRAPEEWRRLPGRAVSDCLERAKASIARIGDGLTQHAIRAYTRAGTHLTADVQISRAFASHDLQEDFGDPRICEAPRTGTANFAGAEDGRTRMYEWRFVSLFPSGITEGEGAMNPNDSGCFGAKLIALGPLQGLILGRGGLPRYAQFSAIRIGNGMIGSVPVEVTTEAGMRMKEAMRSAGPTVDFVGIVGLTNGYMQYVTTAEEYTIQSYEGGSNLYGPNMGTAIIEELRRLAASLRMDRPVVRVGPITATPWTPRRILYPRSDGPRVSEIDRVIVGVTCVDRTLHGTWIDGYPGLFVPADGPVLEIQRRNETGQWQPVAWDDDRTVEVRTVGPAGTGYAWSVSWKPEEMTAGSYRLALFERFVPGEGTLASVPREGVAVPSVNCE
jgi:hypothetical protein